MFALKSARCLPRSLRVEWEDGLRANFNYVWLRDNAERRPSLIHLDMFSQPEDMDYTDKALKVVWPPFNASNYSSKFLRDHAKVKPIQRSNFPVTKKVLSVPWKIIPHPGTPDSSHMATARWGSRVKDHGTLWPHMEKVPSVVTVQSTYEGGRVYLVDAVQSLSQMSYSHPEQFRLLINSPIEYQDGFFKAVHSTAAIQNGKIVAAVFNNDLRSPEITTEYLEDMYRAMKVFNLICTEQMYTAVINPGDLLVVDNSQTFVGAPAQTDRELFVRVYN